MWTANEKKNCSLHVLSVSYKVGGQVEVRRAAKLPKWMGGEEMVYCRWPECRFVYLPTAYYHRHSATICVPDLNGFLWCSFFPTLLPICFSALHSNFRFHRSLFTCFLVVNSQMFAEKMDKLEAGSGNGDGKKSWGKGGGDEHHLR